MRHNQGDTGKLYLLSDIYMYLPSSSPLCQANTKHESGRAVNLADDTR